LRGADGLQVLFVELTSNTGCDIWVLDLARPEDRRPLVATPANEIHGMVSPDGDLLAYTSDRTGRAEVYLDRFPVTGQPIQVSRYGGDSPIWAPDGSELYYLSDLISATSNVGKESGVLAVEVIRDGGLDVGEPRQLFTGPFYRAWGANPQWDVACDGSRFLLIAAGLPPGVSTELRVVLN
jgi:hypothetical protein